MATTKLRSSTQLNVDANFDFQSHKGINLTPGTATGHAVEYDQLNTAISNAVSGLGNSLHIPVADLAAAKAVTDYTDKMLMLIETLGLYRFDSELIVTSTDDTIIRPTNIANDTLAGRWVKMSSTITDHNLLSGLQGGTTGQYYHLTAAEAALLSGSALSKTDDTNITLTLSGSPSTALLRAVGIQVGWTGTLADARIASAANWNSKQAGHANLTSLSGLSYTSPAFVKMTAANTFALDTNTYLTANQTITLSGEASGSGTTGITVTLNNASVIGKVLTGYAATSGTISATDSILAAFQKLGFDQHSAVTLATNHGLALSGQQLAMGTPSNVTAASTNSVTTTTHTHAITPGLGFIGNGTAQYQTLVTGSTPFAPVWTNSANLFGASGLNSLTYVSASFVKMTGANTFTLDTNSYQTVGSAPTSHALESHTATVSAGKLLRGSGTNTFAWSTLTIPDTIAAFSIFAANSANTLIAITPLANQSIRINSAGTAWEAFTPASVSASALTKVDDTNVTLTLGGTPGTALLQSVSLTLGWTGTLADSRITSAATWNSKQAGSVNLTSLSSLSYVSPAFVKMTAANTFSLDTNTYLTSNQTITLTGDISGSGTTSISTTIGANKVTLGMMAQVATQTFLGRTTAATGNVEALTITQAKSMLGVSTRVYRSVVNESPDNARVAFTISTASSILSASEEVYKNGMLMNVGAGNDYTISYGTTNTITFTSAPLTGDVILVNYSL